MNTDIIGKYGLLFYSPSSSTEWYEDGIKIIVNVPVVEHPVFIKPTEAHRQLNKLIVREYEIISVEDYMSKLMDKVIYEDRFRFFNEVIECIDLNLFTYSTHRIIVPEEYKNIGVKINNDAALIRFLSVNKETTLKELIKILSNAGILNYSNETFKSNAVLYHIISESKRSMMQVLCIMLDNIKNRYKEKIDSLTEIIKKQVVNMHIDTLIEMETKHLMDAFLGISELIENERRNSYNEKTADISDN